MRLKILFFLIVTLFLMNSQISAQSDKKFAVLPFEVHGPQEYQYLSQGIQSMLSSRVTRPGLISTVPAGQISRQISQFPESTSQAQEIRTKLGADYLVYGSVTIMDKETSLDVYTVASDEEFDPILRQPSLSGLIPSLENLASDLVVRVIPEEAAQLSPEPSSPAPEPSASPEEEEVFVNPHFKFEDDPYAAGRWRSQTLSFTGVGIALGNTSQENGKTIYILGETSIEAFRMDEQRMIPVASYDIPLTYKPLNINTFDINRDGNDEIIISAVQDESPRSFVLNFEDKKFEVLYDRISFFMNVTKLPPRYQPNLIGQKTSSGTRLFNPNSVQEVIMASNGPELGPGLSLPPNANIFNFTYLPEEDGGNLIVIAENDRLKVYGSNHNQRYTTNDEYSGSALYLEVAGTMPGLGQGSDQDPDYYYIPTRLIPFRADNESKYQLLAHKHFAGLSRIFVRQRNFSEGEIRALFWDDIGLNIHWNTRKIRASIIDFGVYDFDGDGNQELVVLVNTHPGITGLQNKQAIVLAYKMDPANMGGRN
ncbi:MAG: hypothetical protein ABR533_04635 [Desulfonatronovibrio sp.]